MSKTEAAYIVLRQALVACLPEVGRSRINPRTVEVLTNCSKATAGKLYRDLLDGPYLDASGVIIESPAEWCS